MYFSFSLIAKSNALSHRTIRHVRLPICLGILRQVALRSKAWVQVVAQISSGVISTQRVQDSNNGAGKVIKEDHINSSWRGAIDREGSVALYIVGLRVRGDLGVDCVIPICAERVGGGISRADCLASRDTACLELAYSSGNMTNGRVEAGVSLNYEGHITPG